MSSTKISETVQGEQTVAVFMNDERLTNKFNWVLRSLVNENGVRFTLPIRAGKGPACCYASEDAALKAGLKAAASLARSAARRAV